MGKSGQFTYTSIPVLTWRLPQASDVEIGAGCNFRYLIAFAKTQTRDLWL
uniref:Uncharacterized protein n=1 Tax=Arundo donax TaxID=35708 RepID=A0A0A8YTN7_ARUDO